MFTVDIPHTNGLPTAHRARRSILIS